MTLTRDFILTFRRAPPGSEADGVGGWRLTSYARRSDVTVVRQRLGEVQQCDVVHEVVRGSDEAIVSDDLRHPNAPNVAFVLRRLTVQADDDDEILFDAET